MYIQIESNGILLVHGTCIYIYNGWKGVRQAGGFE